MNCYYCDKIRVVDATYVPTEATHDLASGAPRCARHWRFLCGNCGEPRNFMSMAWCEKGGELFCSWCASDRREVTANFWGWEYYFEYQSPFTGQWCAALDRLEFEGGFPFPRGEDLANALSPELQLVRYPVREIQSRPEGNFRDEDARKNWNRNAARWDAGYDEDGDDNRRYQSDEPMLDMLGDVQGLDLLDVGSGNGYLCRKLTRRGARVTGVELSDEFVQISREEEDQERMGCVYHRGSASEMSFLSDASFDRAVSNYVLMDLPDYASAVREVFRLLRPGGAFVVVISHPCFSCGPCGWDTPAQDSPRREDRLAFRVDHYFHRGPTLGQWEGFDPVLSFHRPLRDYWETFAGTGFTVTGFEEPSITPRGRRELPRSRVMHALRVPYSCIFRLEKPTR